ncbi:hypothetical protein ACU4GD_20835 [Cupriavidus basilensis]
MSTCSTRHRGPPRDHASNIGHLDANFGGVLMHLRPPVRHLYVEERRR